MNSIEMDAIVGIVFLILGAFIGVLVYRSRQGASQSNQTTIVREVVEQPVEITTTEVAPYWTQYGLPDYWPSYLSPYWYYDVPYYGPINNSGGYYRPRGPWAGGRGNYAPHGWGPGPIGGHSGVAVGGGGGGGGHGGR